MRGTTVLLVLGIILGGPRQTLAAQSSPSVTMPTTPAGTLAAAWLGAVTDGTEPVIRAFATRYVESPSHPAEVEESVARIRSANERTGGADVLKVIDSSDRRIVLEIRTRKTHAMFEATFDVGQRPDGSPFLDGVMIKPI